MKQDHLSLSSFSSCALSFTCRLNFAAYHFTFDIIFLSIPHNIICHPVPLFRLESGILELIYQNVLFTKKQIAISREIMNVYTKIYIYTVTEYSC